MVADIAADMQYRRSALKTELLEIEARKREIEADLDATRLALKRARNFIPIIGMNHQCPRCWVRHEDRTTLRPIPSDTKDDLFTCDAPRCCLEVRIEMGV